MKRTLREQIDRACRALRLRTTQLFEQAFLSRMGKRRGVKREARSAHQKWKRGRPLARRAVDTILSFIATALAPRNTPALA